MANSFIIIAFWSMAGAVLAVAASILCLLAYVEQLLLRQTASPSLEKLTIRLSGTSVGLVLATILALIIDVRRYSSKKTNPI